MALNRPTSPWRVINGASEGVDLIAEWKIVDAEWYEIFAKAGLERVFTIAPYLIRHGPGLLGEALAATDAWASGLEGPTRRP